MHSRCVVGVAGPFSGSLSEYGQLLFNAAAANSRPDIEWAFRDDKADSSTAVAVAKEFVSMGVPLVIGHFNSACAMTVAEIYGSADIPFVAPLTTANSLVDLGNGWVIRPCGCNFQQALAVKEFLDILGIDWSGVAIICDETVYGLDLMASFTALGALPSIQANPSVYVLAGKKDWAELTFKTKGLSDTTAKVIFTDDSYVPSLCQLKRNRSSLDLICIGSNLSVESFLSDIFRLVSTSVARIGGRSKLQLYHYLKEAIEREERLNKKWNLYNVEVDGFKLMS